MMLEVRELVVRYGGIQAVAGVSLDIRAGEIVALVGANGAGKSSIMHAIAGMIRPTSGSIRFEGQEIAGHPSHAIMGRGIALCPEGRMIVGGLTVLENLQLAAPGRSDFKEIFTLFPRLTARREAAAGILSGGEAQMLALGRALVREPRLLLLDEPSLGLSPAAAREIFALLPGLRDGGLTILVVEQNLNRVLRIADHAYVLESGAITLKGPASDVLKDERVAEAYLGIRREEQQ